MTDSENDAVGLDSLATSDTSRSTDLLCKAVSDGTRRRLLAVLTSESELSLDELTDILAGAEATDGPVGPESWRRLRIQLVHKHLPLLVDAGLVSYGDRTVKRQAYPAVVKDLLAAAGESEADRPARD